MRLLQHTLMTMSFSRAEELQRMLRTSHARTHVCTFTQQRNVCQRAGEGASGSKLKGQVGASRSAAAAAQGVKWMQPWDTF